MDKIQALQVFARTVETGSLTKAADQLNLHISVLSKALKYLEKQLGFKLLNRTTRRLSLTAEGEAFYEKAVFLLNELENTFQDLSGVAQQAVGKIRIDIPVAVMPFIVRHLPDFYRRYPDIQLIMTSSDRLVDLVDEGLDCTIRLGNLADSGYVARRLGNISMAVCASPDYLAEYGMPRTIEELQGHRAIYYFSGKDRKILPWTLEYADKTYNIKVPAVMLVSDSHTLLHSLVAGMGIGYLPKLFARPYLDNGQLVEILADSNLPNRPLWLIYTQKEFVPKRLAVFWEWLERIFSAPQ